MARRKSRSRRTGRTILIVLALTWVLFEGRFYIPKHIRPPRNIQPIEVEMKTTAYCHCRRCCSYKWFLFIPYQKTGFASFRLKHVGITSSGAMVRPGSIAADTSIYPYGTIMYIPGYGYGRVEDTGGAIKSQHIDLYRPNHWFARKWGVRTKKVKVWLPVNGQVWSFNPADMQEDLSARLPPAERTADKAPSEVESNESMISIGPVQTNDAALNSDAVMTNGAYLMDDNESTNESPLQIALP